MRCAQEVEDRELTFSPQINSHSIRIVERLNHERAAKAQEAAEALARGDEATAAAAAAASLGKTTMRAIKREEAAVAAAALSAVEKDVRDGLMRRVPLGPQGLTMLPGHEHETFQPRINPKSQVLAEKRASASVYHRLYGHAKQQVRHKRAQRGAYARQFINTSVDVDDGINLGVTFAGDLATAAAGGRSTRRGSEAEGEDIGAAMVDGSEAGSLAAAGAAGGGASRPRRGGAFPGLASPDYVNVVAYKPKYDFIVRRLGMKSVGPDLSALGSVGGGAAGGATS
jgi:hypothetical protein